jgi:hypothetical protein
MKEQYDLTVKDTWAIELYMLMTFRKVGKIGIIEPKRVSLNMK